MDARNVKDVLAKVPAITLGFWIIKVLATTLGETGGDALSMSLGWGYLASTGLLAIVFLLMVIAQIRAANFNPWLYWLTIIASTTVGTTLADFATRSLGIGYAGGSLLLLSLLLASLWAWYRTTGEVSAASVASPASERHYWWTIMFSQTLGTALGDWTADSMGLGYAGAAIAFAGVLMLIVVLVYRSGISRTVLFWSAFVLTRPLGAVVGDFIDKPVEKGGLAFSRFGASGILMGAIALLILFLPQHAASRGKAH